MTGSVSDEPHEMTHFMAESIPNEVWVNFSFGHMIKNPTVGLGVPGIRTEVKVWRSPPWVGRRTSLVTRPTALWFWVGKGAQTTLEKEALFEVKRTSVTSLHAL